MADKSGPSKVGDVLRGFLQARGIREPLLQASVVEEWPERVGEGIARVTRARGVQEGALFVEVRSSAWLMELNLMKGEILGRVNEGRREGLLEKIIFVLAEE